jgi:DNA polymerase III epsilon subunit-like protein
MTEFKNIMIDLETMGNRSNSVIVSIAAVPFNLETGEISNNHFYERVDFQSCLDIGLKVQASTILWWMQQNEEARKEICKPAQQIFKVLHKLESFFNEQIIDAQVWGNGARFDLGLLQDAYHACGYDKLPWKFRNERDVRTLLSLAPHIKEQTPNFGTAHNAVDDCIFQINYCCAIHKHLMKSHYSFEINSDSPFTVDTPCDVCGRHPNVIITTHKGTFCLEHAQY